MGGGKQEIEEKVVELTDEQKLYEIPDYLKPERDRVQEKADKMGQSTGLAEVAIDDDIKIKNIEATEEAKLAALEAMKEQLQNKDQKKSTNPLMNRAFGYRFRNYTNEHEKMSGASDQAALNNFKKRTGGHRRQMCMF